MSRSLSEHGAVSAFPGWRVLEVAGTDAGRFLHSQLTADVWGLPPGGTHLSALLDRSGRLQAFFYVHRREHEYLLLVPRELVHSTIDRLENHIIADDVSLRAVEKPQMRLVLGPVSAELAPTLDPAEFFPLEIYGQVGFVTWSAEAIDLPTLDEHEVEALRVITGLPRWGVEAHTGQLVNETSLLHTAVSSHKGCYLGQETVNKVQSHRGAAFSPMLLEVTGTIADPASLVGHCFTAEGRRAGSILSAARWRGGDYLQARLHRDLRVEGLEVVCRFDDATDLPVRVSSLPLISTASPHESAAILLDKAAVLYGTDHEEQAMQVLERAIAVCPDAADAYEALGVIHGRRGEYDEAIHLMRRLLDVDPDSVMAHSNLSLYYNKLGRIEEAEHELAQATRKEFAARGRAQKLAAEAEEQRRAEAEDLIRREAMFREILELDPDDPLANFSIGELYVESGRFHEALDFLRRAIAADPKHSAAYLSLGRACEGAGDLDTARTFYSTGVTVAAAKGALMTANRMQGRLAAIDEKLSEAAG